MRRAAPLLALLLIAACGSGPGGRPALSRTDRQIAQRLEPTAQPTSVIATEIAFARAARENGQWTAFSEYAGDGAVMFVPQPVTARDWLTGRPNPATPDRWAVREAWSSCDGSAVVTSGISIDPAGNWSRFTRVWQRSGKRDYRWTHTASTPDAALTLARRRQQQAQTEAEAEDAILVEAASFIRARVAGCNAPPAQTSPVASANAPDGAGAALSHDGTLRWAAPTDADERSGIVAQFWTGSEWEIVPSEPVVPTGG